jgi:predicted nucleic acid-binding protein
VSVVSISGPLINLAKVGHFSLLKDLFQHVLIPKGVFEEVVVRGASQPGSMETRRARWISRVSHG